MSGAKLKTIFVCVILSAVMSIAPSALDTVPAPFTNDKTVYLIGIVAICAVAVILLIIKGTKKK